MNNYSYDKGLWETIKEFKNIFIGLMIVILVCIGLYFYVSKNNNDGYKFESSWVRPYSVKIGKTDSNIQFVYFFDFQCPACKANDSDLEKVKSAYKDKIGFVYRNLPLTDLHAYAGIAAKGGQAMAKQGNDKYFAYKAKIFTAQETLTPDAITTAAKGVDGVNFDQWDKDFKSSVIENEVVWDKKDITETTLPPSTINLDDTNKGVTKASGTPTNLIIKDGKIVSWWTGGLSSDKQIAIVEKALK